MARAFMNIAHRGFSGRYPENTLIAFRAAFDLGCEWVECDVRRTADGVFVVLHDAAVDRTTDGDGRIDAMTSDQVRRLDAGSWRAPEFRGERVPLLTELLDLVGGDRTGRRAVIELKFPSVHLGGIVDLIRARDAFGWTDVSAFEWETILAVRRLARDWRATWLVRLDGMSAAEAIERCRGAGVAILGPHAARVDRALVEAAHEAGLLVRAWGLGDDRGPELRRLIGLGVDGMTTNHPDALMAILAAQTARAESKGP